jgi:exodeoxyribonuclease VII small subunit
MMGKKQTFEEAMQKLEEIAHALENDTINLEDSLNKFDEGMKLAAFCNKKLEEARQQVAILLKKENSYVEVPFDEEKSEE